MRGYLYQLTSSRELFPRFFEWTTYLTARALRKMPPSMTPLTLRKRQFHLVGSDQPFVLRPQTQDFSVARELYLRREYHDVRKWVPDNARLILDLGSNIGLSVRLWQTFFPKASIVAVEPDAENLAVCRENVAFGIHPDRVRIVEAAVAAQSGTLFLQRSDSSLGHRAVTDASAGSVSIRAVTIPDLLADSDPEQPVDLLKCDIEGGERELFANCQPWIRRVKTLIVEVHGEYTAVDLERDLQCNGGTFRVCHTDSRHPHLAIVMLVQAT